MPLFSSGWLARTNTQPGLPDREHLWCEDGSHLWASLPCKAAFAWQLSSQHVHGSSRAAAASHHLAIRGGKKSRRGR